MLTAIPRPFMVASLFVGSVMALSCDAGPEPLRSDDRAVIWRAGPPLPAPVTNNAVAALEIDAGTAVFSFLGLDSTKVWSGVTNSAYRWIVGTDSWKTLTPVPGRGRLASTAQVVGGRIYVLGGYTVAENGDERSVPDVNILDPQTGIWTRGADIPLPTDDAVAGVWQDSLIVLVSGWHDNGNVADVQIFDPVQNRWTRSTSIPGTPVFGHTGAVVGDAIVYVDGVAVVDGDPRYAIEAASWRGDLADAGITWTPLAAHPGQLLYRGAGGSVGPLAVFVGGSDNPYNYNGVGYDAVPSEPVRQVLAYSPGSGEWRHLAAPPIPSMDHRNLGVAGGLVFLVGGMHEGQEVTDDVWYVTVEALLQGVF